jgi:WD40 repeat protein
MAQLLSVLNNFLPSVLGNIVCSYAAMFYRLDQTVLFSAHTNAILCTVTIDDYVVSASLDNTIRVWDYYGNHILFC